MSRLVTLAVLAAAATTTYMYIRAQWRRRSEDDIALFDTSSKSAAQQGSHSITRDESCPWTDSSSVHYREGENNASTRTDELPPQIFSASMVSESLVDQAEQEDSNQASVPEISKKGRRCFQLNGLPAELWCENAPWEIGNGGRIVLPRFVQQRTVVAEDSPTLQERNRMNVWGAVKLAESGVVPEEVLFSSSGSGRCFTLLPPTRSPVPLQHIHIGPGAIPDALADVPCANMSLDEVLCQLNDVLGTNYTLSDPGVQGCLEHVLRTSRDFGVVYGTLRPWWGADDFLQVLLQMAARKDELESLRNEAIRGACIQTSKIPPRRVWDLYSNRVLPFHTLPRTPQARDAGTIPPEVWLVSHSWVNITARTNIWTNINGRESPVVMPLAATLGHVRIELLNMGAQYVWLDILCLTSIAGSGEDERYVPDEWRIDVPSIGYIFRSNPRPCITYFNGLGLPLDISHIALASRYHWLNRAWTLQESTESWLPGGLIAGLDPSIAGLLFARLKSVLRSAYRPREQAALIEDLKSRFCSTELDRIACLAYILGCPTLPALTEDPSHNTTAEVTWSIYIKHMPPAARTSIFLQYESHEPFGLWATWEEYGSGPTLPSAFPFDEETLQLSHPSQLYVSCPGEYYQKGHAVGPCVISQDLCDASSDGTQDVQLHFHSQTPAVSARICGMHGVIMPEVPYVLLGVGQRWKEHWVVLEVVGERDVEGVPMAEVIKWGVVRTRKEEGDRLEALVSGRPRTSVIYLNSEKSLARTKYKGHYMWGFDRARKAEAKKRRFQLEGTYVSSLCEDAPWALTKAYGKNTPIPPSVEQRITSGEGHPVDQIAARNRLMLWGQVKLATTALTAASERDLFKSSGPGRRFTLMPSDIPMQRIHVGNGVVTNDWADISCKTLGVEELLDHLNEAMETHHTLTMPGLKDCLVHFLHTSRDLGEVYGILRPHWSQDFRELLNVMGRLERDLENLRGRTLQNSYINNYRVPPRRVWDLRSNRVLPFHCLPRTSDDLRSIPSNIWSISHSWVDGTEIQQVWTSINRMLWPVPIPRGTSLDHLRAELLNMGAEYVWLDVLCLRQWSDNPESEAARKEEWKLDVPTIGYIYHESPYRPCIIYFNGLGLALKTSSATVQSPRHWFSRAWTMQECVSTWLPGGLTGEPLAGGKGFFTRVEAVLRSLTDTNERILLVEDMRDRYASKELDKIAGLGYLLKCETFPIYEVKEEYSGQDLENAWVLLIKHMHPRPRTLIFLLQSSDTPFSLWVSWEKFSTNDPWSAHPGDDGEDLLLLDSESQLGTPRPGEYYHAGYAVGPCRIQGVDSRDRRSTDRQAIELHFDGQHEPVRVDITVRLGIVLPDVEYTLIGVGNPWREHWVVIEAVGARDIGGLPAVEAVKWAVLRLDKDSVSAVEKLSLGQPRTRVVYLSGEVAQGKSKHLDKYLAAFEQS